MVNVGFIQIHLRLDGCRSLKEKRGKIKSVINQLKREYNLSIAEVDLHDHWNDFVFACAVISNDGLYNQQILNQVAQKVDTNWPNYQIMDTHIEYF
jgi:uncharacterized protein